MSRQPLACYLRCILCSLIFALSYSAQAISSTFDHSHALFNQVLKRHVVVFDNQHKSAVDYQAIAKQRGPLKEYLKLSAVTPQQYVLDPRSAIGVFNQCVQCLHYPVNYQISMHLIAVKPSQSVIWVAFLKAHGSSHFLSCSANSALWTGLNMKKSASISMNHAFILRSSARQSVVPSYAVRPIRRIN